MSVQRRILSSHPLAWALALYVMCAVTPLWAHAQQFDLNSYKALVDAESSETVPVGTHITIHNWQKYRNFFGIGEQALYSGRYQFHVGDGPDYEVVVGPTTKFKEPSVLIRDTEKYSSQVRLIPTAAGSYTLDGWVAGWPFPNPKEPQRAYKAYFDAWGAWLPEIYYFHFGTPNGDRFYNHYVTAGDLVAYRLMHRSDPGIPVDFPGNSGFLASQYIEVFSPEQSKYTTQLTMFRDDPNRLNEIYVFLPSLRRALRLSEAARCSPILGSDYLNDDNNNGTNLVVGDFHMEYIGQKKILAIVNGPEKVTETQEEANTTVTDHPPLGGWPVVRVLGPWEVRKADVIRITPIAEAVGSTYCYSNQVIYLDSEFHLPLTRDVYDAGGKLWKVTVLNYLPTRIYDGFMPLASYSSSNAIIDLQNLHYSVSAVAMKKIGDQVPKRYRDISVRAFPRGLEQVMQ